MLSRVLVTLCICVGSLLSNEIDINNPLVQKYIQENNISLPTSKKEEKLPENLSKKFNSLEENKETDFDNKIKEEIEEENSLDSELSLSPFTYKTKSDILENIKEKKVNKSNIEDLERFGMNFFSQTSQEPLSYISAPDDYILSSGDKIKVAIFGANNSSFDLLIDRDGEITIPKVGKLSLLGLSYTEAKKLLLNKLESFYPKSDVFVSLSDLRTVSITVSGEVKMPGRYNLPALSKIKDALLYSSGITDVGSMRNIQVIRNKKVITTFDLYSLLKKGNDRGDIILRSGDILFIPVAKNLITISGAVKNPAIYELKKNESLTSLIKFAGGVNGDSTNSAKIERITKGKKEFIEVPLNSKKILKDGDLVFVNKTSNFYSNRVSLLGNVYRDESYEIKNNDTLSSLLNRIITEYGIQNIFLPQTDMNYVVVERIDTNTLEKLTLSRNLSKILEKDSDEDLRLLSGDKIYIFNKNITEDVKFITVEGEVLEEGKFKYFAGMKLIDALRAAGIKKESDRTNIRVISYDDEMKQSVKFYTFNDASKVKLMAYDEINISNYFETSDLPTIKIKGAVNVPGEFTYNENLTIRDVIKYAKGLKNSARMDSFELVSFKTVNNRRITQLQKLNLKDSIALNIKLSPYDEIVIQEIKGWNEEQTITLTGEVLFPGEYTITPGEKLSNVIQRAGGFTEEAFVKGAIFTRDDVKKIQSEALKKQIKELENSIVYYSTKSSEAGDSENKTMLLNYMQNIKAQAQDIEVLGRVAIILEKEINQLKKSEFDIVLKNKDTLHIPTSEDSVMVIGEVMTQNALTWKEDDDVMDYILRVGGMKESANKKGIFVIKANGEAKKVGYSSVFGLSSVDVEKGDVVVVPFNLDQFSGLKYAKDLSSVFYQIAVSAASLKTLGAL